jgi:hypothetical protein
MHSFAYLFFIHFLRRRPECSYCMDAAANGGCTGNPSPPLVRQPSQMLLQAGDLFYNVVDDSCAAFNDVSGRATVRPRPSRPAPPAPPGSHPAAPPAVTFARLIGRGGVQEDEKWIRRTLKGMKRIERTFLEKRPLRPQVEAIKIPFMTPTNCDACAPAPPRLPPTRLPRPPRLSLSYPFIYLLSIHLSHIHSFISCPFIYLLSIHLSSFSGGTTTV